MKILFITSGYKRIYEWFEGLIFNELKIKHEVKLFHFKYGLSGLKSMTQTFKPDLALTLVGFRFPMQLVQWLKQQNIKTAVWFTEDPYYMDRTAVLSRYYDYVFSIDSAAVDFYQRKGHEHAFLLPLATDPEVFKPKEAAEKYRSDICLVGYPYPERAKAIQHLLQKTRYKIQVVGNWNTQLFKFRQNPNIKIHDGWVAPPIVSEFYNGAKIVLNTHRPYNLRENMNKLGMVGKSINNRTFDVASCSAFQLIDYKEDVNRHFIENEEIATFKNFEELVEKVHYYINSENEREQIANKGRERVLKEHLFKHRIDKMLSYLQELEL